MYSLSMNVNPGIKVTPEGWSSSKTYMRDTSKNVSF